MKNSSILLAILVCIFFSQTQAGEQERLPAITYTSGAAIRLKEALGPNRFPVDKTLSPKLDKIAAAKKAGKISEHEQLKQTADALLDYYRTAFADVGYSFDKSLIDFSKHCQTYNSCFGFIEYINGAALGGGGAIAIVFNAITMNVLVQKEFRPFLPKNLQNAFAPLPYVQDEDGKHYYTGK